MTKQCWKWVGLVYLHHDMVVWERIWWEGVTRGVVLRGVLDYGREGDGVCRFMVRWGAHLCEFLSWVFAFEGFAVHALRTLVTK